MIGTVHPKNRDAKFHVPRGLQIKQLLKLSNLNENINGLTIFCKILQYKIS
jgi:hypothetical protein